MTTYRNKHVECFFVCAESSCSSWTSSLGHKAGPMLMGLYMLICNICMYMCIHTAVVPFL